MHVRVWWENLEISLGTSRRNVKILEEDDVREWVGLIRMYTVRTFWFQKCGQFL